MKARPQGRTPSWKPPTGRGPSPAVNTCSGSRCQGPAGQRAGQPQDLPQQRDPGDPQRQGQAAGGLCAAPPRRSWPSCGRSASPPRTRYRREQARPGRRPGTEFMAEHQEAAAHPDHGAPSRRRRGDRGKNGRSGQSARLAAEVEKEKEKQQLRRSRHHRSRPEPAPPGADRPPPLRPPWQRRSWSRRRAPPPPAAAAAGAGAAAGPAAPDRRNPTGRPLPPNPERAGRRRAAPAGTRRGRPPRRRPGPLGGQTPPPQN